MKAPVIPITKENKRCVYKLLFPDGSFYIGSTSNIFSRISGYKSSFKNSIGSVNKLIAKKWGEFNAYQIVIIEVVPNNINPRDIEEYWIIENLQNGLLLNRSKSAFSNKGMVKSR